MKKVLFTATVDSHILHFHIPYLKWFKEQGYEVHVATNGDEQIPYCDVKHKISFERSPIKINNLKAIKQLKKIIDEEKFNIIHCHTPMGSVVTRIAAMKSRKENRTRVIYTAHGFHFFKGAPIQNWLIFYPIEKILSYVTDCLITINEEDYKLAKKKFKAKQIELVHGVGVDENKFNFEMTNEEKHSLRQELDLNDDDFVMIYPAELSKRKNQGMLLQVMKMLKDEGHNNIKLLLPGKDSMNGKYQQMAKDLEINENVKFLGYRKDIPKLMKISDLAVSTAKQEGLPVNLMEAMICGLPIIANDCRGNRDLVIEHKTGYLIEMNNNHRFAECIDKIYNNKKKYDEYGKNNQKSVKRYLINNIIPRMQDIYMKFNHMPKIVFYSMSMQKGGAERVIANLSNYLSTNNFDIYIVCNVYGHSFYKLNEDIKYITIDKNKSKFFLIKLLKKISYRRTYHFNKIVDDISPDLIISFLPEPSLRSLIRKKRKVIVSVRNDPKIEFSNPILKMIMKRLYRKADGFIFQTEDAKKYFENFITTTKEIIPNPIDEKFLLNNYCGEQSKDIIAVGRLEPQKNYELLIKAFGQFVKNNIEYNLKIYGMGSYKNKLEKIIGKMNLNNKISFMGQVDNIEEKMKIAKMLVMSSDYEGMPNALMEALAIGVPCICTDCPCGGPKFLIKDKFNGILVPTNDVEELTNAMNCLIKDEKLQKQISINAKESMKKLNPTIVNGQWKKFIENIIYENN